MLQPLLKSNSNLEKDKREQRSWKSKSCDCRIFKTFIDSLSFCNFAYSWHELLANVSIVLY